MWTAAQALESIADLVSAEIASSTNGSARSHLAKALKALVGNPGANNGALHMLEAGNDAAALAFLRQALPSLERAGEDGAAVGALVAQLQSVIATLVE